MNSTSCNTHRSVQRIVENDNGMAKHINITKFWNNEQQTAFEKLKKLYPKYIGYYNLDDQTQFFAGASPVGLGCVP